MAEVGQPGLFHGGSVQCIEGDARYCSVPFLTPGPSVILLPCSVIDVVTGTFSINPCTNAAKTKVF